MPKNDASASCEPTSGAVASPDGVERFGFEWAGHRGGPPGGGDPRPRGLLAPGAAGA